MSKLMIPLDTREQLVCNLCHNYLSFFPIYITQDGSSAICGRCKVTDRDKFIRDVAYENIAQFLLFPCRYKSNGCKEQSTPSKVVEHEDNCLYHKFDCPTKVHTKCPWQGTYTNLKDHFTEKHRKLLLEDDQFEISFITSYKEVALFVLNKEFFIIHREVDFNKENFIFSIRQLKINDPSKSFDYFLQLLDSNKTYSYRFPRKAVTGVHDSIKVSKSLVNEKLFSCVSIVVKINIIGSDAELPEESLEESVSMVRDIKKNPNISWALLTELECPVCFEFMLPPIHQCVNGHSLCSLCKSRVVVCPLCKKDILETKNFTLEKMTQHLIYPCRFYKSGCGFFTKATEIPVHEENCEFGPVACPFSRIGNCRWASNVLELLAHVEKQHNPSILKSDRIDVRFEEDQDLQQSYLLKFSEKIFLLYYKYSDRKFRWALQVMGSANEAQKYMVEIDVVDNSKKKLRCYMRGICVPAKENIDGFTDSSRYLMMTLEQIKALITTVFSYNVRIIKE